MMNDLIALRFGSLTILRRGAKVGTSYSAYWDCACDCGREVTVRGDALTWGRTRSCGCNAPEPPKTRGEKYTGKRFGRWTVTGALPHPYMAVRCECGTEGRAMHRHLKTGASKSCGCLRSELATARAEAVAQAQGRAPVKAA